MTRKDYVRIAVAVSEALAELDRIDNGPDKRSAYSYGAMTTACHIASALYEDNPRFNRDRFLDACKASLEEIYA